ncbi:hypothetical protein RJ639_009452 [Escallonia herrerae]|uniref:Uncharacterized protein n=1 Tax=Escallonia herrerae TaxID=1293975 RepID=A0AA88VQD9_9ASTE|nr:hypothetical protein RJ639_009452 [Escallonia herrerae]
MKHSPDGSRNGRKCSNDTTSLHVLRRKHHRVTRRSSALGLTGVRDSGDQSCAPSKKHISGPCRNRTVNRHRTRKFFSHEEKEGVLGARGVLSLGLLCLFIITRPICSVLTIALQLLGIYPSCVSWTFTITLNVSVSLAMYSLLVFYHVFGKELAQHKPLSKSICIKGVLDVEHIQEAIQNLFVCLEMIVFSVLQHYAFHRLRKRDE